MISIIVATVVLPVVAARDSNPRRAIRRMIVFLLVFNALYIGYVTLVHARFQIPQRW